MFFKKEKLHSHYWTKDEDLYREVFKQIIIKHKIKAVVKQKCSGCNEIRYMEFSLGFMEGYQKTCSCSRDSVNINCDVHGVNTWT